MPFVRVVSLARQEQEIIELFRFCTQFLSLMLGMQVLKGKYEKEIPSHVLCALNANREEAHNIPAKDG